MREGKLSFTFHPCVVPSCSCIHTVGKRGEQEPWEELNRLVGSLEVGDVGPALEWIDKCRPVLEQQEGSRTLRVELDLHRVGFLKALRTDGKLAALSYARRHFWRFAEGYSQETQELMGALLFGTCLEDSPYRAMAGEEPLESSKGSLVRAFCRLHGHSPKSPLLVCVSAGALALPDLTKLTNKLSSMPNQRTKALGRNAHLPVEIPLGKEFCFRSVFACPVARDLAGSDNPPMLLPCGHVLGERSIQGLCRGSRFRCTLNCPQEVTLSQCMRIFL